MDFLILEKKCKIRRFLRKFFVLFFLSITSYGIYLGMNKIKKSTANNYLSPIIDLNITLPKEKVKKIIKKPKKSTKNYQKHLPKSPISIKTAKLPSFKEAIDLAYKFYKEKNYKEAIKWAKYANIKNKYDKRSWIITAKSLYRLGKKEKAIEVLKIYYEFSKDKEIKNLIKELK